jgi:hypothetical protein
MHEVNTYLLTWASHKCFGKKSIRSATYHRNPNGQTRDRPNIRNHFSTWVEEASSFGQRLTFKGQM